METPITGNTHQLHRDTADTHMLLPLGETRQNNHWSVAARYLGEDRSGKDWIFILVDSANSTDVLNDTKTILDMYTSLHFE